MDSKGQIYVSDLSNRVQTTAASFSGRLSLLLPALLATSRHPSDMLAQMAPFTSLGGNQPTLCVCINLMGHSFVKLTLGKLVISQT